MDKLRDIQSPKTESERNRKYEQNDYQEWNWITGFPVLVAKTLDKIPAGQIQQYTERIIHYDEEWVSECEWVWVWVCVRVCVGGGGTCGFILGCKYCSISTNQSIYYT